MNKAIIAGVAAGVLVVALVFSPLFNTFPFQGVQAQNQSTAVTRHYAMVADEMEL